MSTTRILLIATWVVSIAFILILEYGTNELKSLCLPLALIGVIVSAMALAYSIMNNQKK